jgi:uncharacterized protein YdiU (UPF0061 family)
LRLGLIHSYAELPARLYAHTTPTAVAHPELVVFNTRLAEELGLQPGLVEPSAAAMFSGNQLPEDANPIAMAYAGHQFGSFVPQLGDGRAILLGEIRGRDGALHDLQLKGAGRTPYSRGGDGRAALGPMLREYLISEAMHFLRIPTTRSLAVVKTGEPVFREEALPGAILARVAASHVRVGTFQYLAARADEEAIRALLDYVISRHFPAARETAVPALAVLEAVAQRQAVLIADWLTVGFIHGVMNTDNMAIFGETIDYGPCAFMDNYDPKTVFSSIDRGGRYAYANQPLIAQWNLARFAETLLPLIDPEVNRAVDLAMPVIESFMTRCNGHIAEKMNRKIGLASVVAGDAELVRGLLTAMEHARADFTLTFRRLSSAVAGGSEDASLRELFTQTSELDTWLTAWRERLQHEPLPPAERVMCMRAVNPAVIPRNHHVEAALSAASERDDLAPFFALLRVLQHPFEDDPMHAQYERPPEPSERVLQTFCGT